MSEPSLPLIAEEFIPEFSWQEISKHHHLDDCWVVIDGYVYDITTWVNQHPGGNAISILAGEDASAMYHCNHLTLPGSALDRFLIGKVIDYQPEFQQYDDKFLLALKNRVVDFFEQQEIDYRKTRRNYLSLFFTTILLILCWFCMYLLVPWGFLAAIPMGLATCSLIGSFGHEKIHGNLFTGISRVPGFWAINNLLWGIFIPFMPERYFQYEHIKHHNAPMHPEHDYDIFAVKNFVRLSPGIEKRPWHMFQHIFAPFVYGNYLLLQLLGGYTTSFFKNRELLKDKGALRDIVFSSFVAFSVHIAIPIYLTNPGWVLLCAGIYFFTWQAAIYISSGVPHMSDADVNPQRRISWSYYVCESTNNLKSGNWFFNWLTGGLNNHLTHHLLPSVPQEHLHKLAPIVEQTCEEHGYPYGNYSSFKLYYRDHYQFLLDLGKLDAVEYR